MCSTVHVWVHAISAYHDLNIPRINDKFRISRINVLPLCGISMMSYHLSILEKLSGQFLGLIVMSH
jgi:hypothetical protein